MRIWNTRTKNFSSTVGKIVMALVFASVSGSIFIAPAFGKDNDNREGYHDQGEERSVKGRKAPRRVYQEPPRRYYYPAPVYAPPPVIYTPDPYQSPGINFIFPIQIR
jgi:hypothetical protein